MEVNQARDAILGRMRRYRNVRFLLPQETTPSRSQVRSMTYDGDGIEQPGLTPIFVHPRSTGICPRTWGQKDPALNQEEIEYRVEMKIVEKKNLEIRSTISPKRDPG